MIILAGTHYGHVMRWLILLAVTAPPLVLAAIGLTHPQDLTPQTAEWWTNMHILLVPIFPLLGVAQWILVRGMRDVLSWAVRVFAFLYITFYGVVDAVAGIGTGTLVQRGVATGGDHGDHAGRDPVLGWLFGVGNEVGTYGGWAFLIASVLLTVVAWRRWGQRALPGGLVLVASSYVFLGAHIYWPVGVLSMLGIALGFGLLALAEGATPTAPAVATDRTVDASAP
jgi:hypothetical protein